MLKDNDPYAGVTVPGWDNLGPLLPHRGDKRFVRIAQPHGGGARAVLKLLPENLTRSRTKRFYAEATETRALTGTYGVLPVLDIDTAHTRQPHWYVTPQALLLREQTDKAEALQTVVELVSTVAWTLERLARDGIYHRDIKPDNLFWHDYTPVVADFGIARWPGRAGLTRVGEKVGPYAFTAPEMREAGGAVDGHRADVYSLAKTLFVLAMGQQFPPDGTHRPDADEFGFTSRWEIGAGAGKALVHVLEAATAFSPGERLTMAELRTELGHWLTQHPRRITRNARGRAGGWGPITSYRRDMDEIRTLLYQCGTKVAAAAGRDTEPGFRDAEHPAPLLGTYDWPVNSDDGFEADGWNACTVDLGTHQIVLGAALYNDEVSLIAEAHEPGPGGNPALAAQWGRTPWTRPRLPSAQAHAADLVQQVITWLTAHLP
jgi:hypothetical protein